MEMNYFADRVCKAVGKELGKDYEVKVQQVRKNNGICRTGLLVLEKGGNTAPTVYLESFYKAYKMSFVKLFGAVFVSLFGCALRFR